MEKEKLDSILAAHAEWLDSGGKRGKHADLSSANLRYADLRGANLGHANLSSDNLGHANLSNADLGYANLSSTDLRDANLEDAYLGGATGVRHWSVGAHWHGECGRTLLAVDHGEKEIIYYCGCFRGTRSDLVSWISDNLPSLAASRMRALAALGALMEVE